MFQLINSRDLGVSDQAQLLWVKLESRNTGRGVSKHAAVARTFYRPTQLSVSSHCFAQSCKHSLVSELKVGIRTNLHVPNQVLCKAVDLNRPQGTGFCSD